MLASTSFQRVEKGHVVASDASPPEGAPFRVGDVIGDSYAITSVLGVGGMGVVYEARDLLLARTVAIKVPLSARHTQTLRLEAQALAAIKSPGVVTVHQIGRHQGVEFMVMERLFGETLQSRLQDAAANDQLIPLPDVVDLLVAIAGALSAAHAVGIAQRDLKPANIMICGERVVLVDLGLFVPEVLVAPENDATGSVEYIAPEVLLRMVEKGEGPLIDLYALGILAFELLTNVTPFAAESLGRVLANHVGSAIPDVGELRTDIPRELAALVSELLAKAPKARPPSADDVLWRLVDIRDHGIRRSRRLTVLAVDDEPHVCLALKYCLEAAFPDIRVETTTDPRRATSTRVEADVVLVDLHMPDHNGLEVCMNLLALPLDRRPLVVAMSAQATEEDLSVLRAVGVRDFVPKDDDFIAAMKVIIRGIRSPTAPRSRRSLPQRA
jgi:eukaryotic-like serine/threonine-protein kinase